MLHVVPDLLHGEVVFAVPQPGEAPPLPPGEVAAPAVLAPPVLGVPPLPALVPPAAGPPPGVFVLPPAAFPPALVAPPDGALPPDATEVLPARADPPPAPTVVVPPVLVPPVLVVVDWVPPDAGGVPPVAENDLPPAAVALPAGAAPPTDVVPPVDVDPPTDWLPPLLVTPPVEEPSVGGEPPPGIIPIGLASQPKQAMSTALTPRTIRLGAVGRRHISILHVAEVSRTEELG
jgi:hypothetical protein